MTHHRACIHTYTHRSALARQARKQPENTLATRHFAKHNTRTHTHMRKHTQNSPFVGGGLPRTGTRYGRKVFCQAPLLDSQKGTQNTNWGAAAKQHCNRETGYLLALGHTDTAVSSLFCVSAEKQPATTSFIKSSHKQICSAS